MAITYENLTFTQGSEVILVGLVDNVDATAVVFDSNNYPLVNGEFTINLGTTLAVGSYALPLTIVGGADDGTTITETIVIEAPVAPISGTSLTEEEVIASITKNDQIQDYIPDYQIGKESNTDNVEFYPGSTVGFKPLEHNDEVTAEQLSIDPSAGYAKKFPVRRLMTNEVRAEYFPYDGDFDPKTITPFPLGRRADLLEDGKNSPEKTIRGGANSSPLPTTGFTF